MFTILGLGGVVVFVLGILNHRAVGRMLFAAKAQIGKLGRSAQQVDVHEQYLEELDDVAEEMSKARKSLQEVKALKLTLGRLVNDGEVAKAKLEHRIKLAIDNNDPNGTLQTSALELARVEKELEANNLTYSANDKMYQNYVAVIRAGEQKIQERQQRARQQGVTLRMSEKVKNVLAISSNLNTEAAFSKLDQKEALVLERIDANQAAIEVAQDLSNNTLAQLADDQLEQEVQAKKILERFQPKLAAPKEDVIDQ